MKEESVRPGRVSDKGHTTLIDRSSAGQTHELRSGTASPTASSRHCHFLVPYGGCSGHDERRDRYLMARPPSQLVPSYEICAYEQLVKATRLRCSCASLLTHLGGCSRVVVVECLHVEVDINLLKCMGDLQCKCSPDYKRHRLI